MTVWAIDERIFRHIRGCHVRPGCGDQTDRRRDSGHVGQLGER
jgi:hypothetical protein